MVNQEVQERNSAIGGLDYYKIGFEFQQRQIELLKIDKERLEILLKRNDELNDTIARQNIVIEELDQQLQCGKSQYDMIYKYYTETYKYTGYLINKGNNLLTKYYEKTLEQQDQLSQITTKNENQETTLQNLTAKHNNLEYDHKQLQRSFNTLKRNHEKAQQDLNEYNLLAQQWEKEHDLFINQQNNLFLEDDYLQPLTPNSQELLNEICENFEIHEDFTV